MPRPGLTKEQKEAAVRLYTAEKLNVAEVARRIGSNSSTVTRVLTARQVYKSRWAENEAHRANLIAAKQGTLCWTCKKATNRHLCSWVENFTVPEGAETIKIASNNKKRPFFTKIQKCPNYEEG